MIINGLWIKNFRCINERVLSFEKGKNELAAPNGSGKSSVLEALTLLTTGESWRIGTVDEVVTWGQDVAMVQGRFTANDGEQITLEATFTRGVINGRRTSKKLMKVNGVSRPPARAGSLIPVVIFVPNDMRVFEEGPDARRRLLDRFLDQVFPPYAPLRRAYQQTLRRRNQLLHRLKSGEATRNEFFAWDTMLIAKGEELHHYRQQFLTWLSNQPGIDENYQVFYDHSIITKQRLEQYAAAEVSAGYTLVGPHRDDWDIRYQRQGAWRSLTHFGSRGEQRLALLWWLLQSLRYLETQRQEKPLCLLDDIMSELDTNHQAAVTQATSHLQTIITTAP